MKNPPTIKTKAAAIVLHAADVLGMALSISGAAAMALVGKLLLSVVLLGIAMGLLLRLTSRRRGTPGASRAAQASAGAKWIAGASSAVIVAALVEATNLPVRFGQPVFAPWHWALVLCALGVAYRLLLDPVHRIAQQWRRRLDAQS